jgi:hypothetical protein
MSKTSATPQVADQFTATLLAIPSHEEWALGRRLATEHQLIGDGGTETGS